LDVGRVKNKQESNICLVFSPYGESSGQFLKRVFVPKGKNSHLAKVGFFA
jgi:hypothetical protein